ncbi:fimbria/pilus outer membrane usher protein, partial [Burkholderia gladioli]|uniref:fimbria/pilus outer membrane usher protein n=1 Tax=Burkholderia gladioli TaxID=28095 RepID=UPI001641EBAA
ITGVQIAPEQALLPRGNGSPVIQGIAHSQARVEVRQGGILIHSTVVPPGPFSFSELPLLSTSRDVTLKVIEADGRRHGFSIPAAAVQQLNIGPPAGFSMSLGKLRNLGGEGPAPWLASVAHGIALGSRINLNHGVTLQSGCE